MVAVQPLVGTSVTVTETFSVDGTPLDLDSGVPTIVALYPDGTAVTPAPTASGTWTGRTTGQYRIVLDAELECTILDPITWTGTIGGQPQTLYSRVEWVGNHLFTEAQLRAHKTGGNAPFTDPPYTDAMIHARRAEVTDDFAERTGWSFTPRYHRETITGRGTSDLIVSKLKVQRIIDCSIDGTALTAGELADLRVTSHGVITRRTTGRWPAGADIVISYVHGWSQVPGAITSAALARTAMLLMPSVSSTVSQWTSPDGTTYSYDQSGQRYRGGGGIRAYGVPSIDSVLADPAYNARGLVGA